MSDCVRPNGRLSGARRREPRCSLEKPTLSDLGWIYGEPPWELNVPDLEVLPEEATPLIKTLVWRGVRFTREDS